MDLAGRTVAVTGAGGFIGAAMVARARALGMKVRGLEKNPAAARRVREAEIVVGDVCDAAAARRACEGADVVLHTAAILEEDGEWSLFRRVNVEGTRTMAEAARAAGARRFVHLSSVMVYGFHFPPEVAEDGPLRGDDNPYCQTKIESEEALRPFHAPGKMEVIVIRPGDVYGPGSVPWVVRPVELMRRRMFALVDGGRGILNHVYIDNLLDGIFAALQQNVTGEAFNLTDGVATTCAEYFGRLARMTGRRLPSLPSAIMRPVLRAVERAGKMIGKTPPMRSAALDYVLRPHRYSNEKARRVLAWTPRVTLDEGMRAVEDWLRAEGKIR